MIVDKVKTDAMFGCGKPRLMVDAGALPEVSKHFDVVEFIRDTIRDLSYTHPILNKRRFTSQSLKRHDILLKAVEPEKSELVALVPQESTYPSTLEISTDHTEMDLHNSSSSRVLSHAKESVSRKDFVLPPLYDHQGYKACKRDFSVVAKANNLEILEAGKYTYVRSPPLQRTYLPHASNG